MIIYMQIQRGLLSTSKIIIFHKFGRNRIPVINIKPPADQLGTLSKKSRKI